MDEQKKPEASGRDEEQLGPYQLHEQVVQDELSHGELFRATHETSGATALVFKPAEDDAVPLTNYEPRLRWRLGLALAGAAAVGALLFALLRPAPVSPPPVSPESLAGSVPAPISQEVPANGELFPTSGSLWGTEQNGGPPVLARPLPKKPYKGQRRPPCKPRVEAEMIGACWVPHMLTAPCPEDLYEHQGRCYTASMASPPEPRSLGH